jgi:FLVCR family MFS transporter 7
MNNLTPTRTNDGILKNGVRVSEDLVHAESSNSRVEDAKYGVDGTADKRDGDEDAREMQPKGRRFRLGKKKNTYSHTHFQVYKRRWLGLMQLVLLNIVVSWDVSTPSVVDGDPASGNRHTCQPANGSELDHADLKITCLLS